MNSEKTSLYEQIQQLETKNAELKCTISGLEELLSNAVNIKYLDRQEVEKIIDEVARYFSLDKNHSTFEWGVTAICNLVLKIDRDKIVEETDAEYDITNRRFI